MSTIGWIGQGWIGKHYADDFEHRGIPVVRYALEAPYDKNQEAIQECDIVFVAVPTPTTVDGFSYAPVSAALENCAPGTSVVIKSTLLPGTTVKLQAQFPQLFVMHSPEFLVEKTAAHDAAHPKRNIIGIPELSEEYKKRAYEILDLLPEAPYTKIMATHEAELVKYAGNCFLYQKVLFMNVLHDYVVALDGDWNRVREAVVADERIGKSHTEPIHQSGRGAGGHCFIKDFEAMRRQISKVIENGEMDEYLAASADLNNRYLIESNKDLDLLADVYGDEVLSAKIE